jgi:hypothetical protein
MLGVNSTADVPAIRRRPFDAYTALTAARPFKE